MKIDFYDNLFCANHRSAMLEKHGYTEAEWITIEQLMQHTKVYAV